MAITPNKAAIEAAGLEYVEPHEIVKDTGPKALNLLAHAVIDIQAKPTAAKPTIITSSTFSITEAGEYVAGVDTTVTLDNGQSLPMQRGQAIVAIDVSGQLFYSDFITLAGPKPPSLTPGELSATATQTEITATVTGAKDSESGLHAAPYRFSRDSGTSWTPWQAGISYTFTGLITGASYNLRAEVRNIVGDVAQLSLAKSTAEDPNAWGTLYFDDFNDAPDGSIDGRPIGDVVWEGGAVADYAFAKESSAILRVAHLNRLRVEFGYTSTISASGVDLYFAWDGVHTGRFLGSSNCLRLTASRAKSVVLAAIEGGSTGVNETVTTIASAPAGSVTNGSRIVLEMQGGEVVAYVNGDEKLRAAVPDYPASEAVRIVTDEYAIMDDFALRVA